MTTTSDVRPALPGPVTANPRIGNWVAIRPTGVVEVRSGKVELGQGVLTALAQIAAEELDVDVARVRMAAATTGISPDEGLTAGSMSVQSSGSALRVVCAEARARYLAAAAHQLGVPEGDLTVDDGLIVTSDGRSTSYWALADDTLLDQPATGEATPKPASGYRTVGTNVPRLDLPDKLSGHPRFIHDVALPGQLYGRIVRPPSRGATLTELDATRARALPGVVAVVQDGNFLGVVAEHEEVALQAADRLRAGATWQRQPTLPDEEDLQGFLTTAPAETAVLAERGESPLPGAVASSVEATYHRPYIAHASMGPSSATALVTDRDGVRLEVWTHSQGVYILRRELARALDLDVAQITVRHVEGPGCYGHNGADDVAFDAAMLAANVPGRPVQVVWSRADELGWSPFGPAAVVRIAADLDADGEVLSWQHEIWGNGHATRPGSVGSLAFLGTAQRAGGEEIEPAVEPPMSVGGAAGRNAVPGYDLPAYRVVNHRLLTMPLRTSALRSLGAVVNVFAAESFIDELADAAGRDPIEYRLAHLSDLRARAVIQAAAERSGWATWSPADSVGHGLGYARYKNSSAYCAVVAEVEATHEVRVRRLTLGGIGQTRPNAAVDVGFLQPVVQAALGNPEILRDLTQRRLAFAGHRHNIVAELLGIRLRHDQRR